LTRNSHRRRTTANTMNLYSADELMAKTGCESIRQLRAWLRKNGIRAIDAPGGPVVTHEALLEVSGLRKAQNESELYDPATTV